MADTHWMRKGMKRWTIKEAMGVSLIDRLNMSTPERANLAQFLQNELIKRERQFKRAGIKGFALTKLEQEWGVVEEFTGISLHTPIIEQWGKFDALSPSYMAMRNPSNQLSSYIAHLLDFFAAKSSTVRGWRAIGLEQDNRLFGKQYQTGKRAGQWYGAKMHLTDEERTRFWQLYHELYNAGWSGIHDYSSESQREVASFFIKGQFNKDEDISRAVAAWRQLKNNVPESYPIEEGTNSPFPRTGAEDINDASIPTFYKGGFKKWFLK